MKIFVLHEKQRYVIDAKSTETIAKVKESLKKVINFGSFLNCSWMAIEIRVLHNGVVLADDIILNNTLLSSGSTITCKRVITKVGNLRIKLIFINEIIELPEYSYKLTIAKLKTIIQNKTGVPVSAFWLLDPKYGRTLYDRHDLEYYGIDKRDTLHLEIWQDIKLVVEAALRKNILQTIDSIANYTDGSPLYQYLLRVVLFIAAHHNTIKLATQAMRLGGRCQDYVSEHPSRLWCREQSSKEIYKTSVHQAAQQGSYECLDLFLRHCAISAIKRDGYDMNALYYAGLNRHAQCYKLVLITQFKVISLRKLSNTLQESLLRWARSVKEIKPHARQQKRITHSNKCQSMVSIGTPIHIDGYPKDIDKNSKSGTTVFDIRSRTTTFDIRSRTTTFDTKSRTITFDTRPRTTTFDMDPTTNGAMPQLKTKSRAIYVGQNSDNLGKSIEHDAETIYKLETKSFTRDNVISLIKVRTGCNPTQLARRSIHFAKSLERQSYMKQLNIALKSSTNCIYKK